MNLYQLYWNILGIENILKQADTFPPKILRSFLFPEHIGPILFYFLCLLLQA